MRYHPPPGWPPPPPGWRPPPGWTPDPSWPPPPPGWRLWVPDRPWYGRTWTIVGALVAFFPLGLVLTWLRTDWSRARRGWITAAVAAAVLAIGAASPPPPPRPSPAGDSAAAPASAAASPAHRARTHPPSARPSHRRTARPPATPTPRPTPRPAKPPPAKPRPAPKRPRPRTCGAPPNPYGLNLCGAGALVTAPPADVCSYFDCIGYFWHGRGYMVRCDDGMYSLSGGRRGTCSSHGGEGPAVRRR